MCVCVCVCVCVGGGGGGEEGGFTNNKFTRETKVMIVLSRRIFDTVEITSRQAAKQTFIYPPK